MDKRWIIVALGVIGMVLGGTMVVMYLLPLDLRERSPQQPIAFSHRQHAGANGIPCLFCHRHAASLPLAGIPAMADCRACHLYIAPNAPEVKKLLGYWDRHEAIPWVRVHLLPDHVYFPHMMHSRAGIDCSVCHGPVVTMERITRTASLKMGWCLGCHRQHRASIDCWTCHV